MKLELKHLAYYLPYGIMTTNGKLSKWMHDKDFILRSEDNYSSISIGNVLEIGYKPILRPMSDITKKINQNGKTINIDVISFKLLGGRFLSEVLKEGKLIDELPHGLVTILYMYHFDVFGLIENGLAVSYNDTI